MENHRDQCTRGEEREKGFGAVVDVLITASGENFKASEIGYFSSCSNFAAEVMVEKIVVQSAVDSEHGRVWSVTVIISIGDSKVNAITRLVRAVTFREGSIAPEVGAILYDRTMQRTVAATFCLNALNSKMGREYAMYGRPASGLEVRVRVHNVNRLLCLFEDSAETIRLSFNFFPRGELELDNSDVSVVPGCVISTHEFNAHHKTHGCEVADTKILTRNLLKQKMNVCL